MYRNKIVNGLAAVFIIGTVCMAVFLVASSGSVQQAQPAEPTVQSLHLRQAGPITYRHMTAVRRVFTHLSGPADQVDMQKAMTFFVVNETNWDLTVNATFNIVDDNQDGEIEASEFANLMTLLNPKEQTEAD